jgi:hypothetical protein
MDEQPSLGQLIWLVRRELEWARQVDADQPLRFDVETVEMDVDVEITRATKGEGGLDLKVFGIGAKAGGSVESAAGSSSKVHLVLSARDLRSSDHRLSVAALDTEPPPRRAELPLPRAAQADGHGETAGASPPTAATDTEPPPLNR